MRAYRLLQHKRRSVSSTSVHLKAVSDPLFYDPRQYDGQWTTSTQHFISSSFKFSFCVLVYTKPHPPSLPSSIFGLHFRVSLPTDSTQTRGPTMLSIRTGRSEERSLPPQKPTWFRDQMTCGIHCSYRRVWVTLTDFLLFFANKCSTSTTHTHKIWNRADRQRSEKKNPKHTRD